MDRAAEPDERAALPLVIFVTGLSCTGKTTLARALAERFDLPLFSKDAFKEMMFDIVCPDGDYESRLTREMSQLLGRYSLGCLEIALGQCVRSGVPAIFEANFNSRLFSPRIASLREQHPFRALQVHLQCRGDILLERFIARERTDRHPGHGGLQHLTEVGDVMMAGSDEPLILENSDDLVILDTTELASVDYRPLFDLVAKRLGASHDTGVTERITQ
ncbi:MAG: AAA family ATPase [Akkermansiaceae bacterium]|nr:AAA family ATPase [Armatimonadota bacterium]